MRVLPRSMSKALQPDGVILWPVLVGGPPGNPLVFFEPDGDDSIELSTEIIDQLSSEQQTYFDAKASFDSFADLYTGVSAQDWFNDGNVMGTLDKGIAFYDPSTSQYNLNKGLAWFGLPTVELTILDKYLNTDNYTDMENYV